MKNKNFPPGWNEERVREVLEHYETQTDEEAVAEDAAAYEDSSQHSPKNQETSSNQ